MPIKIRLNKGKVPVKIFTDDIDNASMTQLSNISQMPFIHHHIAAMPDVHQYIVQLKMAGERFCGVSHQGMYRRQWSLPWQET